MIDPNFKEQLMTALASAVEGFNKGAAPNEAVAKAAAAADFNVEQTRRLCETFNTARTIHHFNNNPDSKEASFDLADPNEVLAVLFNEHGGAKSAQVSDMNMAEPTVAASPGYSAYEERERPRDKGGFPLDQVTQPNSPDMFAQPAFEELPSLDAQAMRARKILAAQQQLAEQGDDQANGADLLSGDKLAALAHDISQDFWFRGATKLAALFRAVPAEQHATLEKLCEFLPKDVKVTKEDMLKCGMVLDTASVQGWTTAVAEVDALTKRAASLRRVAKQLFDDTKAAEQKFFDLVTARHGGRSEEDPFAGFEKLAQGAGGAGGKGKPSKPPDADKGIFETFGFSGPGDVVRTVQNEQRSELGKPLEVPAAGVGSAMQDFINQGMGAILNEPGVRSQNKAISERLRNQQREVILHDLMMNDPYLAEADPERITSTFQAMWQIAPEASLNKEVVRSVLRQGVHTPAFSPYDAASLADLEKTIREVQGSLPGRPEVRK